MNLWRSTKNIKFRLGTYGPFFWRRNLTISPRDAQAHSHLIGLTKSGKSTFMAGLILQFLENGEPLTLIDPHGDLARLILSRLVTKGYYRYPTAFENVIYLDLPGAERARRYLPFNILKAHGRPHSIASNVKEAFHRAYPELATGAPMFDTLIYDGVKVLASSGLPITQLYRLLTNRSFRESLLAREEDPDPDIVSFFHDQFDRLRDQADQAGAALRRAHLLTAAPVLKYSLGQDELLLNFRDILDSGKSIIINLALEDREARRLFGCLLTVAAEQAAVSRAELPPQTRYGSHHLFIDEFSEFVAQSEEALETMLSQTRKYGLYLVMAHQTWSQTSTRLKGALQNVEMEVVFRLGRDDAEYTAKKIGKVDFSRIKHEVVDEQAVERTHPLFFSLGEQWEELVQGLQDLRTGQAYLALYNVKPYPLPWRLFFHRDPRRVVKVNTQPLPYPNVDKDELLRVEEEYLRRYFRPASAPTASTSLTRTQRIQRL